MEKTKTPKGHNNVPMLNVINEVDKYKTVLTIWGGKKTNNNNNNNI